MTAPRVAHWHIGHPPTPPGAEDGVVAFTAMELAAARPTGAVAVGFHDAIQASLQPAGRVEIYLPAYRSRSLVPVLSWLAAARLARSDAPVTWYVDRRQGPDSIRRLLTGLGWELERDRQGRQTRLAGKPPAEAVLPPPQRFTAALGRSQLQFFADYGVFSSGRIDDGTELLLSIALDTSPVESVADIGTGYGPLAIGLVANNVAGSAVATDVDCLALWLARENGRQNEVPLTLLCTAEPTEAPPTALTVCSVPTHINRVETERLLAGLAVRARRGRLLAVLHASLEARYARHLEAGGLRVRSHPGRAHVVLDAVAAGSPR